MKHSTWLQNRTPTRALDGKTPYEMRHGKKPYLAGIQEFRTAAYVKDLNAGKLDPKVHIGRFVGYDSESKGYQIYWPKQKSISVEWNVVFNASDVTLDEVDVPIPMDPLAEGERDKVIQSPKPSPSSEKPDNQTEPVNEPKPEVGEEPEKVPFPSENPISEDSSQDTPSTPVRHRAERLRDKPTQHPGFYKDQMSRTAHLEAHTACQFVEEDANDSASISNESDDLDDVNPPPEFDAFTIFDALSSSIGSELKTLDKAFNGPKANEW